MANRMKRIQVTSTAGGVYSHVLFVVTLGNQESQFRLLEDRLADLALDVVVVEEGLEPFIIDLLPESPNPVPVKLYEEDAVVVILAAVLRREVLPADTPETSVHYYLLDVELYPLGERRFPQFIYRLQSVVDPREPRGAEEGVGGRVRDDAVKKFHVPGVECLYEVLQSALLSF